MANTYTLISSNVLGSSAASVTFSAIPSTYTDLVIRMSVRLDAGGTEDSFWLRLNGLSTSIYSKTSVIDSGGTALSLRDTSTTQINLGDADAAGSTSNTFSSVEFYLPNYAGTTQKPSSIAYAQENNSISVYQVGAIAGLTNLTSAVSSITLLSRTGVNLVSGSSFYLYGIKNS
jgi:hypothetical protein